MKRFIVLLALAACGPNVKTVDLAPTSATLSSKGQSQQLAAVPMDAQGKMVEKAQLTWVSSAPEIAAVDAKGTVTAHKSGAATITACSGKVCSTAALDVRIPAKLSVEPAALTLSGVGTAAPMVARAVDDAGRPIPDPKVEWSTNTPGVVTLANGQVVATAPGSAPITVRLGGLEATAQVTVTLPPFEKVLATPAKVDLVVGGTTQVQAAAHDQAGNPVPGMAYGFKSSDEKVATVDARGVVTAVAKGKATVSVAAGDKSASVAVKVK